MEPQTHLMQPRPYQLEMFEESMRQNIIVAMDTGTGKTHVAILRIQAELERCRPNQLVWFLGPKVALCDQQHLVLRDALPAYEHLYLSGADGVDKWTNRRAWDAVLQDVRVVVATPAVLKDALTHAFVDMSRIALLVFDESHSMNEIMKLFYFHEKREGRQIPAILGLTASPVRKMSEKLIRELELNLDAKVVVPKLHRSELIQHANRPVTGIIKYNYSDSFGHDSPMLRCLRSAYETYDLDQDPYIVDLRCRDDEEASEQIAKAMVKRETFCVQEIKSMLTRCHEIEFQLGPVAADWFIRRCKEQLTNALTADRIVDEVQCSHPEQVHLGKILAQVCDRADFDDKSQGIGLSHKFEVLLATLLSKRSSTSSNFTCIIFAKQRVTVSALTHFLTQEKLAQGHFTAGSFVGSSSYYSKRRNLGDLSDVKKQQSFLDAFRSGEINLMISTDVLEEGIDIPACNLVICFDPPQHLTSFIQRRGRARQEDSEYIIMLPNATKQIAEWQAAEQVLLQIYSDEDRQRLREQEAEMVYEPSDREFRVASTGALLTLDSVIAHLHRFCSTLKGQFVDVKPRFSIISEIKKKVVSATVSLPAALEPSLRIGQALNLWRSERRAKQDAAFVAYRQLYDVGLVNEHLLPTVEVLSDEEDAEKQDMSASIIDVKPLFNPWFHIAKLWSQPSPTIFEHELRFNEKKKNIAHCSILLPTRLPCELVFEIYLQKDVRLEVTIAEHCKTWLGNLELAQNASQLLLKTIFRNQPARYSLDPIVLLLPAKSDASLADWLRNVQNGRALAKTNKTSGAIVFDSRRRTVPHTCSGLKRGIASPLASRSEAQTPAIPSERPTLCAALQRLLRPRNFLSSMPDEQDESNRALRREQMVPITLCSTNNISWSDALPAYTLPSIIRHTQNMMIANELKTTILAPLNLKSNDLVLEAICTSSAREIVNYQRLEFLGDCVLKCLTSMHLMAEQPNAPEAQLSALKDRRVSNKTLATAALSTGLDQFIIDDPFTGSYIQPPYIKEVLAEAKKDQSVRPLSRKTLADVVEALIGVAYLEGIGSDNDIDAGLAKSSQCLSILLGKYNWQAPSALKPVIFRNESPPSSHYLAYASKLPEDLRSGLSQLLQHDFTHTPLLISALTHPSQRADLSLRSYDRLEFLGDALLDLIITTHLFCANPNMPHPRLHSLRSCCVNEHFLSHICMSTTVSMKRNFMSRPQLHNQGIQEPYKAESHHSIWHYMRRDNMDWEFTSALKNASEAHHALLPTIESSLERGSRYPWTNLMAVGAPKCMSDLIESTLAAVWLDVDTAAPNDAFAAARRLLDHIGITEVMRHLTADKVECINPKERLYVLAKGESVEFRVQGKEQAASMDSQTFTRKIQTENDRLMTLLVDGTEVARIRPHSVKEPEVMSASRVSELNQWRLADLAISSWDESGGGAEVVCKVKQRKRNANSMEQE